MEPPKSGVAAATAATAATVPRVSPDIAPPGHRSSPCPPGWWRPRPGGSFGEPRRDPPWHHGGSIKEGYPLVNIQKTKENGHRDS